MGIEMIRAGLLIELGTLLFFGATGCKEDVQCDDNGAQWCDEDEQVTCTSVLEEMVLFNKEVTVDCSKLGNGATCLEVERGEGRSQAACVLEESACSPGVLSLCVGDDIGSCARVGYPEYERSCTPGRVCVIARDGTRAECAYRPSSCTPSTWDCDTDDPSMYYRCDSIGTWSQRFECEGDEQCEPLVDGGVTCRAFDR